MSVKIKNDKGKMVPAIKLFADTIYKYQTYAGSVDTFLDEGNKSLIKKVNSFTVYFKKI